MAIVYGPRVSPSLDLNFARNKSLVDTMTGRNLIDFGRVQSGSSKSTYFGADGLLKYADSNEPRFDHDPTTGESLGLLVEESRTNLIVNSEIFTNWNKVHVVPSGPPPAITPNAALAPDGTYTASSVFFTASSSLLNFTGHPQLANLTTGVQYTFSVYLKVPSGTATVPIGINEDNAVPLNDVGKLCNLTTSWQRFSITSTKTNGNLVAGGVGWYTNFGLPLGPATDTEIHIWGAQFEAGSFPTSYIPTIPTFTSRSTTATYYDANGVIQTAGINVARDNAYFPDENGVMKPAGLLLEAAGINYIEESVNLTNTGTWSNYKFLTPTLNAGTAPDGTTTATSLVPNTENSSKSVSCTNIATTFQGTLTVSVFAKANGYNKFNLSIDQASAGGAFGGGATFDLSTGTVTPGASGVGTITKLPNGWYRCAVTHTNTAQAFTVSPGISGLDNSGNTAWAGDGTSGYLFWGFQLEESPYPTSYIPTSGSTVTRAADVSSSSTIQRTADVAQITGSNFSSWYNQSEGSFFLHERNSYGTYLNHRFELNQNSDPNGNAISFAVAYGDWTRISSRDSYINGSIEVSLSTSWTQGGSHKYAYGLEENNFSLVSGANSATDTSGTFPPNLDSLSFGAVARAVSLSNGYGKAAISRITYYPQRLQDTTLQKLTS